jgi:hypothetical protein
VSEHTRGRSPELLGALLQAAARPHLPATGLTLLAGECAVVGLIAFGLGLFVAPGAAWGAYLASWLFWTGAALGGAAVTASLHLTESRWGRVVERTSSSLCGFLPLALLLLLPLPLGRAYLWTYVREAGEHPWPIIGGALLRDGLLLLAVTALAAFYFRGARRADKRFSVAVLALFILTGALLAMDLHISLDPPFRSTIYPLLYLAGSYYTALALTAVAAVAWRRDESLRGVIAPEDLLDLGNLVWGFALFLGYLWWCQYLPVWLVNLPREAAYHLIRWRAWPWDVLSYSALGLAVVVPGLALSSRMLKKSDMPLLIASGCGAVGVLLQRIVDVQPPVPAQDGIVGALVTAGVCVGFAGLFGLCYLAAARRVPLFPVHDPKFLEALQVRKLKA